MLNAKNLIIDWHSHHRGLLIEIQQVLVDKKTQYQRVQIVTTKDLGKCLFLDGDLQSTTFDERIYHECLVHPALFSLAEIKHVLIIGGAEGASLREVLKHPIEKVTLVDIDQELVDICKIHLQEMHRNSFSDPRVSLVFKNGLEFLQATEKKYDAIILDLTSPSDPNSRELYTTSFYRLIESKLSKEGVVVTQATSPVFTPEVFSVIFNTIKTVFSHAYPYVVPIYSFGSSWGLVMASKKEIRSLTYKDLDDIYFLDQNALEALFKLPAYLTKKLKEEKKVAHSGKEYELLLKRK